MPHPLNEGLLQEMVPDGAADRAARRKEPRMLDFAYEANFTSSVRDAARVLAEAGFEVFFTAVPGLGGEVYVPCGDGQRAREALEKAGFRRPR